MKKKVITAFVASVTLLSLTATSTMASQLEEDFNTKTSCYNDETGIIHVIDASNDNKELFEELLAVSEQYEIPIVLVRPLGSEAVPLELEEKAATIVGCNANCIIDSIKDAPETM